MMFKKETAVCVVADQEDICENLDSVEFVLENAQ